MTPAEAAAVLGVSVDSSAREVQVAYRRAARDVHPDRQGGASMRDAALASATFIRVTEARDLLLALAAATSSTQPAPSLREARPSTVLTWVWIGLLIVGIALSVIAHEFPLTPIEPAIRFALLAVSASAFAWTGRQLWWVLMWVAIAATALETIVFTTLGSLLGMLLMAAPIYGLSLIGFARRRMREANARVVEQPA
jgi:hypothetical protein